MSLPVWLHLAGAATTGVRETACSLATDFGSRPALRNGKAATGQTFSRFEELEARYGDRKLYHEYWYGEARLKHGPSTSGHNEVMAAATHFLSVSEFEALYGDRKPYYEYWYGEAYQKPMPTILHSL